MKISDPVLIFAVVMSIMLVAPMVFTRLRAPGLIGLIAAGAIVGPHALGFFDRTGVFDLLGTVGLLYLMFLAGLEINVEEFVRRRGQSLWFGGLTFLFPQALGTVVARFVLGFNWPASFLTASMFASHTLLTFPIVKELGLGKHRATAAVLGGTLLTDTAALMVLAVVAENARDRVGSFFWLWQTGGFVLLLAWALLALPFVGRRFFRSMSPDDSSEFLFMLAAAFVTSWLAHALGVEPIIGAFLAGLALGRFAPERGVLMNRLQFTGETFFIPFFLVSTGMLVDSGIFLSDARSWAVSVFMIVCVTATKWLAAAAAAKRLAFSRAEAGLMFGMSVNQAAATLAAAIVGHRLGILDDSVINGTIMMIMFTCLLGPVITQRFGRRVASEQTLAAAREPAEWPGRTMVCVSKPDTSGNLIDLALMVRRRETRKPMHVFTVVLEKRSDTSALVLNAERMLGKIISHAVAAGSPVSPVLRIDSSAAGAILRAAVELKTETLILGWTDTSMIHRRLFGSVADHVADHFTRAVMIARLPHPMNSDSRLVVAAPPYVERQPGFAAAFDMLMHLGAQTAGQTTILASESAFAVIDGRMPPENGHGNTKNIRVPDRENLAGALAGVIQPGDRLALLCLRKGRLGWSPSLEHLPGRLERQWPGNNMILVYPDESENGGDEPPAEPGEAAGRNLPPCMSTRRFFHDMPGGPLRAAVETMLASEFGPESGHLRKRIEILMSAEPVELTGEIVLLHGHTYDLDEPTAFLATSGKGFELAGGVLRPKALILLLSPSDQSPERHMEALASLAMWVKGKSDLLAAAG